MIINIFELFPYLGAPPANVAQEVVIEVEAQVLEDAVESATTDVVFVWPARMKFESGAMATLGFSLDRTVTFKGGRSVTLVGAGTQSNRITCVDPTAFSFLPATHGDVIRVRGLMFDGCGVSIETDAQGGVYIDDCVFRGVRRDWCVRGNLSGASGPSRVVLSRCSFLVSGSPRGTIHCEESPDSARAIIGKDVGFGLVWVPSHSEDWVIDRCNFAALRGAAVRVEGRHVRIVGSNFEAQRSSPEYMEPYIDVAAGDSVSIAHCLLGAEPCTPHMLIRVGYNPTSRQRATPQSLVLHALNAGGTSQDPDDGCSPDTVTDLVSLDAPIRGLRLSALQMRSGYRSALRLPHQREQGINSQNVIQFLGDGLSRWQTPLFVDASGNPVRSSDFDMIGDHGREVGQRDPFRWRDTQNLLPGSEAEEQEGVPLFPWRGWVAEPSLGWTVTEGSGALMSVDYVGPPSGATSIRVTSPPIALPQDSGPEALHVFSVWVILPKGTFLNLSLDDVSASRWARRTFVGAGGLMRYNIDAAMTSSARVQIRIHGDASSMGSVILFWPQLERGCEPTDYRRVQSIPVFGPSQIHWPAGSWAVGSLGLRLFDECAYMGGNVGDRLIGTPLIRDSYRTGTIVLDPDSGQLRLALSGVAVK